MLTNKPLDLPRFIALCGNPNSGKTTVQQILQENYGVTPVDDGGPLRNIGIAYLGLTHDQVHTQEGKKQFVEILGKRWQVREILGEVGNRFEAMFGTHIMPFMVCHALGTATGPFSFGSVRKDQGGYYRSAGGIVIEIRNRAAPPSQYQFDGFDEALVDYRIQNDFLADGLAPKEARLALASSIEVLMTEISARRSVH